MIGTLDLLLFHRINAAWIHPVLDSIMPVITRGSIWGSALILLAIALVTFGGRKGRVAVLSAALAVGVGDFTASQVGKPFFHRPRPCHADIGARVLIQCGGQNGFPSNHAVNTAAATAALTTFYPVAAVALVPATFLIGWSRIYLGVHYPADVAAGWLYGGAIGAAIAAALRRRVLPGSPPSDTFAGTG